MENADDVRHKFGLATLDLLLSLSVHPDVSAKLLSDSPLLQTRPSGVLLKLLKPLPALPQQTFVQAQVQAVGIIWNCAAAHNAFRSMLAERALPPLLTLVRAVAQSLSTDGLYTLELQNRLIMALFNLSLSCA